ncbi:MAG: hypothetical protein NTW64_03490 [Candidatus Omnitrophica bacterium]|nr:hypothetical protein [Candidatus Omnitrophota bacterium]
MPKRVEKFLDVSVEDGLKLIVYGGIIKPRGLLTKLLNYDKLFCV